MFRLLCFVSLVTAAQLCDVPSETVAGGTWYEPRESLCPGDLIFEDNFDHFDLTKWQHENTLTGGGNWEFQYYLNNRSNSFTRNGNLHIHPSLLADDTGEEFLYSGTLDINGGAPADACTNAMSYGCLRTGTPTNIVNPIKSARIRTTDSFYFKYGSIEVRAKSPAGDWLWPAVWLMPRFNFYGGWPSSGEIDLLETRGNQNLLSNNVNVGTQQASSTLHWGPSYFTNQYTRTHFETNNAAGFDSDFHTFKVVWNSNGFVFYIDNDLVGTITPPEGGFWEMGELEKYNVDNPWKGASKMAPFDQQFYLIINLAVGGTNNFFSDDWNNPGGKPWKNTSPTSYTDFWKGKKQWHPTWYTTKDSSDFVIDYIRVYAV